MTSEPTVKRAITFIDGQNLYHCAREAFGITHPNFDVMKISKSVCDENGWMLSQARFYTGFPSQKNDPFWSAFWQKKLLSIKRQGVCVFSRPLRYHTKKVRLDDGTFFEYSTAEEKGIDVRIAIDIISLAISGRYDVAIIFSQDQDLSEAAKEIRTISTQTDRWIKVACAFPSGGGSTNNRGINQTDWIRMDRSFYDRCTDNCDYR